MTGAKRKNGGDFVDRETDVAMTSRPRAGANAPAVLWFRRDLRLTANLALDYATANGREVVALFVLDEALCAPAGPARLAFLYRNLRTLSAAIGGRLVVRAGAPTEVVPAVATEVGASEVVVAADSGRYGRVRDKQVAAMLAARGSRLRAIGSPYAVAPGTLRSSSGNGFSVFGAYRRAWDRVQGGDSPSTDATTTTADSTLWRAIPSEPIPEDPDGLPPLPLPAAGECAALTRLDEFLERVSDYAQARDTPAAMGTSGLSAYLKYGCIHPRQILAGLGDTEGGAGADKFRSELCWRDFYADILWHHPDALTTSLRPEMDRLFDDADAVDELFARWCAGMTGYPMVDAAMRQLQAEAWVANRARMVAASFLTKHLHVPWQRGARHFLGRLVDGDAGSNNLSWQWVAGTGTDAAPYLRIFNPTLQSKKFDPNGAYIRRWVPELRELDARIIHEPWRLAGGPPNGYPKPIVDLATARDETLRRFATPSVLRP